MLRNMLSIVQWYDQGASDPAFISPELLFFIHKSAAPKWNHSKGCFEVSIRASGLIFLGVVPQ